MEWTPRGTDSKEDTISLQWLKFRLVFISQDEGMAESPMETLEKAIVFRIIWTGGLTSLLTLERYTEFIAS